MQASHNRLFTAIQAAVGFGAATLACFGATAYAQSSTTPPANPNKPVTLQTIVVTGTHISGAEAAGSNPVVTIGSQQIQATGKLTLGAIIQQLPAITGSVHTADLDFGGNTGGTFVGLRGLGSSRTLVLIDGQRVLGESNQNVDSSVDLNSIPAVAVDRIEVLKDGASAIYGTDAIGGVINIILKSDWQGAQFTANYGISDHDDGERRGASFIFGQTTDKGSLVAGVSYNQFDPVTGSRRKFTRDTVALTTTSSGRREAFLNAGGNGGPAPYLFVALPPNLQAQFGCAPDTGLALKTSTWNAKSSPTTLADYQCYTPSDNYNFNAIADLVTPQERTNGFLNGKYRLTNHVSVYATVIHDKTNSSANVPPGDYSTNSVPGVAVSKDSYYNPFGVDFSNSGGAGYDVTLSPLGMVVDRGSTTVNYLLTGLRGDFDIFGRRWTWDVGFNYSHISLMSTENGLANATQLAEGAGPSFLNANGVVQCGTSSDPIPLAQCTPWDPFNTNAPSTQAVLSNRLSAINNTFSLERGYHADATGGIADLPGGTAQLAVGIDYRQSYQGGHNDPALRIDPDTGTCELSVGGSCNSAAIQGGFNVKEAYGELFVPILQGLPFAHEMSVTAGYRYSRYSDFGSTSNWKLGLAYRPIQDLLLRGTVSSVFRAPTIKDLFLQPFSSGQLLTSDPCQFVAPTPTTPNPNANNPACVGVPKLGTFLNSAVIQHSGVQGLISGSTFANFQLQPETGKSFDFGAVYSPPFVPGLTVSADYWRIYLKNLLTIVAAQTEINLCSAGDLAYCPLITRIPTGISAGDILHVISPTANLGRLDTKGVDFSGSYRLPAIRAGQFTVQVQGTYLTEFRSETAPGTSNNVVSNGAGLMAVAGTAIGAACPDNLNYGGTCYLPRWRAQATFGWQLGPLSAQWTLQYLGRFHVAEDPEDEVGVDQYGATMYSNLTAAYDLKPIHTRFEVGVDNVFNKQAPLLFMNRVAELNTDTENFDILGRYYWARATVTF